MANYGGSGYLLGSGVADSLNKAINSIFWLTFKMASFYGFYTYLTHTVFGVSIVIVPVLVAAFLAAIPVAGQYLVAVPAALELWLSEDRPIAAILIIVCHILPTLLVDVAIYSEVKGGIHPWLTGLSIVGGIYYFGIPGAIYGPLVLCAVFVVLSMYPSLLNDVPTAAEIGRSQLGTPIIKRSESVY